jgi:hypothetical protein
MAFVRNLFGSKFNTPETIPTDTIIPLFERDDSTTNRAVALEFTMVFEDVLNADKLSGALWKLLQKPGWKKLGARLRLNVIKPFTKVLRQQMLTYIIETRQTRLPCTRSVHRRSTAIPVYARNCRHAIRTTPYWQETAASQWQAPSL